MEFTATYVQLTYTLLAGLLVAVGWIYGIQREVAVLKEQVKNNKEAQESINDMNDKKFERIDVKLDKIIELIMNQNGKK